MTTEIEALYSVCHCLATYMHVTNTLIKKDRAIMKCLVINFFFFNLKNEL